MTGVKVVRVGVVDSTQRVAFELAEGGASDLTVVVAESQTAGRGRRGRRWHDEAGASLLASIVLRPRLALRALPLLGFVAAVAVAETLALTAGLKARLKWPNDVLVDGRKIAGLLLESRQTPEPVVVVGIGVNLAQRAFPPELADTATSVALAGGAGVDRERLLGAIVESLDGWRRRLEDEGFAAVRARWLTLADTIGRAVVVDGVRGTAVDIAADGALVVDDGTRRHRVVAGAVEPAG